MAFAEELAQLQGIARRLRLVNEQVSERLVTTSNEPDLMSRAYAAIGGEVSGAEGLVALRAALLADGVAPGDLNAIESLYVSCLLDPTVSRR